MATGGTPSFDNRIAALAAGWEHLGGFEANPRLPVIDGRPITIRDAAPSLGGVILTEVADAHTTAQRLLEFEVGCLCHDRYIEEGLDEQDLRTDPNLERRASLLAMMTAPPNEDEFHGRRQVIGELLDKIVAGGRKNRIEVAGFDGDTVIHGPQSVVINNERSLYAVLGRGDWRRTLVFHYDTPTPDPTTEMRKGTVPRQRSQNNLTPQRLWVPPRPVLCIGIPQLFEGDGILR